MLYRPFWPYDSYLITAPADGSYSSVLAGAVSSYTTSSSAAGVCVASWLLLHCCSAMIALPEVLADSLDTTHMVPGTSRMCYSCALIFFFCCLTVVRLYHHNKWKYFPSPSFVVLNISLLISLISKAIFCLLVHCVSFTFPTVTIGWVMFAAVEQPISSYQPFARMRLLISCQN